jgi:hypothetical protein
MTKMINKNLGNSVNNIQVEENILSEQDHGKLLQYVLSIDSWETQPWGVRFVASHNISKEIVDILEKVFKIAHKKCIDSYSVELNPFENKQIPLIRFEKGYSMNEHADTTGDFAALYYINDDYKGGEINFMDHGLKIKPKANSLITFPSNADYWHEVLENTEKERYSSTVWFHLAGSSPIRPKEGLTR